MRDLDRLEITFELPRRVDRTLAYQRYYLQALDHVGHLRWAGQPVLLRLARSAERKLELDRRLQPLLGRLRPAETSAHVASYVASHRGRRVRFAVDAHDGREVRSPEALSASDVYFKANRWPADEHDPRVVPIVNGNGLLGRREIGRLRALRGHEKDIDVVFVSRVWAGREHNLRLFEELARLPVRSELHAIFPPGTPLDEAAEGMRRLRSVGVRVGTADVPAAELWETLARARVVLLRPGKHLCVPWRMLDLLCMGACVVVDSHFGPAWPVPLRAGANFVDAGLERPEDTSPAPPDQYARVGEAIVSTLADAELRRHISVANARYFDDYAAPERVGDYVRGRLLALLHG